MTTIAEQVQTLKARQQDMIRAELLEIFAEEQAAFEARGVPEGIPDVGAPMPDGELLDVDGNPTTLADRRQDRPAVLIFYRGAWCPYCNLALRSYQEQLVPALAERGVTLIALSPQRPDESLSMQEKNQLSFEVVSDPGNQISRQLGILNPERGTAARAAANSLGADVAATNADGTDDVPMPTAIVLDTAGTVRWIDVHPNYTTRSEPGQILTAVDAVLGADGGA